MKRADIIAGLISGVAIALLADVIVVNLAVRLGNLRWALIVIFPAAIIIGLWIAAFLSRFWKTFWPLAKFLVTGGLNTLMDLGVLNLLEYATGMTNGIAYTVFKGTSFTVAVINSFFWNKYWVFSSEGGSSFGGEDKAKQSGKEFVKFILVSLIGFGINVGTASFLVNVIGAPGSISIKLWGTLAAVIASFIGFAWNFIGYKIFVFKNKL